MKRLEKVAVVLTGCEDERRMRDAVAVCGWVELRVDRFLRSFPDGDVAAWARTVRSAGASRIIATVRRPAEQSPPKVRLSECRRLELYRLLAPVVDWVDVEVLSPLAPEVVRVARSHGARVILSWHNFQRTPSPASLKRVWRKAAGLGPDIVKVAAVVRSAGDLAVLLSAGWRTAGRPEPVIVPMGEIPAICRLAALAAGSLFTYACLSGETAPGQPTLKQVRQLLAA